MTAGYTALQIQAEARRRQRSLAAAPPSAAGVGFRDFIGRVNPRFQWYHHCEVLADVLQRVTDGQIHRLMVFMPPRHGKSEQISRLFTAYYLYRYPEQWVGMNSYAADLAYTFSRAARDHYGQMGGQIKGDAAAVKHWETGQGGGLWAAGVGGPITGKGFHLGIIDDPIKNAEEAASETIQASHRDWYDSTFYTRAEPNASIVVVQTRWNEADLSGYLLDKEADEPEHWHIVNLEAIKEDTPHTFPPTCTVEPDWRAPGAALCPERYPIERLTQIQARVGAYFFGSLFQQRPAPREGNQFKRGWFELVGAVPAECTRVRYWDKAGAAEGKGDYTVGLLMARDTRGYYYVEDVVRGQWEAHERNTVIAQTAHLDRERYSNRRVGFLGEPTIYIEQPPGLAKESTDAVVRLLAGFTVYADPVNKDKVERAEPFKAQAQAGNVKVVTAPWTAAYLDELCAFPTGKHDDQVDGSSGAFNHLTETGTGFVHRYDTRYQPQGR